MWRGCRRLLQSRSPLARLPRPPPVADGSGPVGPGGGRTYAPPAERKRFYQNVSISQGEGGFEINLDHRKLKTPQAKLFTVPSEALAIAVATEWDSQKDTIKFYTMHLTTLCNTALDNPTQRNKMQLIRAAVKFLETDTVWYEMGALLAQRRVSVGYRIEPVHAQAPVSQSRPLTCPLAAAQLLWGKGKRSPPSASLALGRLAAGSAELSCWGSKIELSFLEQQKALNLGKSGGIVPSHCCRCLGGQ
ncbi:ATP synthase mitochondrial F1 complex assembly factor 2 isoform 2-T2 [Theristicus caerulescens]